MENISIGTGIAVFGAAFACWAWVVAWGIGVMRREMQDLKSALASLSSEQHVHINQTERRLTMLETEFTFLKSHLYRLGDTQREP